MSCGGVSCGGGVFCVVVMSGYSGMGCLIIVSNEQDDQTTEVT